MTLFQGETGGEYRVKEITGAKEARRRLLELGFVKGTRLKIYNFAPFKVTMLVSLRGYMLALRQTTGESVIVEEC